MAASAIVRRITAGVAIAAKLAVTMVLRWIMAISLTRQTAAILAVCVSAQLAQRNDEIRSFAGFAGGDALIGNDDRTAGRKRLGNSRHRVAGMVRRSSASAGLSGSGTGLAISTAPAILRRRVARSSSSRRSAWRVAGSETTDQCRTLASSLSASAVNTAFPAAGRSARSSPAHRTAARILPDVELGVLAADEYRDLSGALWPWPAQALAGAAFSGSDRRP